MCTDIIDIVMLCSVSFVKSGYRDVQLNILVASIASDIVSHLKVLSKFFAISSCCRDAPCHVDA